MLSLVLVTGHRGAAGLEPENTLRAVRRAMELGVDQVEIDVRLTRDGHLVVIHDEKVDRTTNGHGRVSEFTLEEIKKLDAGKGESIPTLKEVLELVKGRIRVQIELKERGIEEKVVRLVEAEGMVSDVTVTSFFHEAVKRVKEVNRNIETGVLFVCSPIKGWQLAIDALADALHPNVEYVTPGMIEEAHRRGLKVKVWNTEDADEIRRLIDMGVDAIGSDRPDIVLRVLRGIEQEA